MKLLIITQKVDKNDSILGFFHNWIVKLSEEFEKVSVVCLQKGESDLPQNVKVFSLGKELQKSRLLYVKNFYQYITGLHNQYDVVFVHMNQEYVLLGGLFWKILGKKIYFWRNHPKGNFLTRMAVWFSDKAFCTSPESFTAKYKKTELMPVGIDTLRFTNLKTERAENSILFLSRMDSIKRPDLLIEALNILDKKEISFTCNFYGNPTKGGEQFYESLKNKSKEYALTSKVSFCGAVPNSETPKLYNTHKIFVNLTPRGSMDKTILESAICGALPLSFNPVFESTDSKLVFDSESSLAIAEKLEQFLNLDQNEFDALTQKLQNFVFENHSLNTLIERLEKTIKNQNV